MTTSRTSHLDRTPAHQPPLIVKHSGCPQWGLGYLVEERDDKRFYDFEDGLSHSIARAFWGKLEPVQLGGPELTALESRLRGLRAKSSAKKPRPRATPVATTTFAEQLTRFAGEFPGGFEGETFIKEERGVVSDPSKIEKKSKAYKAQAIGAAQTLLAASELRPLIAAGSFEAIFERAKQVHKAASGLLHPLGDIIPFSKMPPEHYEAFAKALFDVLHGEGDFSARFDRWVETLAADGLATWPLATAPAALFAPEEHAFVKPSFYEKQATVLGIDIGYERVPSSAAYGRMQALAGTVRGKLVEAGEAPRDLLDVFSFLWRMNSPVKPAKPAKPAKPKAAKKQSAADDA
jgi:hypothetical protein